MPVHRGHVSVEAYSVDHFSVWHISDVVYLCSSNTMKLVGREEVGENVNFPRMRATLTVGQFTSPPLAAAWDQNLGYETASLGVWQDALPVEARAALCTSTSPPALELTLEYGLHRHSQLVLIIPSPPPPLSPLSPMSWARASVRALAKAGLGPPPSQPSPPDSSLFLPAPYPSQFAMCTTVLGGPSSLLTAWLEYHALLGVGAFYIFVVSGGSPATLLPRLCHHGQCLPSHPGPLPCRHHGAGVALPHVVPQGGQQCGPANGPQCLRCPLRALPRHPSLL